MKVYTAIYWRIHRQTYILITPIKQDKSNISVAEIEYLRSAIRVTRIRNYQRRKELIEEYIYESMEDNG